MRSSHRKTGRISENNHYLPEELWRKILTKLPAKSLLIFRSVSKQFRDIIDNPSFISMHLITFNLEKGSAQNFFFTLERSKSGEMNFIKRRSDTLANSGPLVHIPNPNPMHTFKYMASIDGLILLSKSDPYELTLWNPCIRKSLVLPPYPYDIAFETVCVLGFSPTTNCYKLVVFDLSPQYLVGSFVAVYSFRQGCWSRRGLEVANEWYMSCHFLSSNKGFAYCFAAPKPKEEEEEVGFKETHVACFDFDVEEFSFVELPRVEQGMLTFLFVLGGSLAAFGISPASTCIWVMKKDGGVEELWSRWYSGDSDSEAYEFFITCINECVEKVVFVEEFGTFLVKVNERLKVYNLKTHEIQYLGKYVSSLQDVDAYVESLLLLGGFGRPNF